MTLDLRDPAQPAMAVVQALGLLPHPEGGFYREVWRDTPADGTRGAATTILFLLAAGQCSHWHRVDAAEIWCWQAGAALRLDIATAGEVQTCRLGPDLSTGEILQAVVPAGDWQAAESLGGWSLVGCAVAPAFRFEGFEIAPPGWQP